MKSPNGQPFQILLIIWVTAILFIGLSFVGQQIEFSFFNGRKLFLKFYDINNLVKFSVENNNQLAEKRASSLEVKVSLDTNMINTVEDKDEYGHLAAIQNYINKINIYTIPSEFPILINSWDSTHHVLDRFFEALLKESPSKIVRVAHYGDSQIEGDRLTFLIRQMFQKMFGGNGVGFIPFTDITSSPTYIRYNAPNWKNYNVHNKFMKSRTYGMSGMAFQYGDKAIIQYDTLKTISGKDSLVVKQKKFYNGNTSWVDLSISENYHKLVIQYGFLNSICRFKITENGLILLQDSLTTTGNYCKKEVLLPHTAKHFRITFSGESPLFYGISFDPNHGIQIDNFGIRGHSGKGLCNMDTALIVKQFKIQNTKLIILQFGANVIPYYTKDNKYVINSYDKLIKYFKQTNPHADILIIGPADMARMVGGSYMSYVDIDNLNRHFKTLAQKNQCAFFDMYNLMGGQGSVLIWARKGWMSYDGHLTYKGQSIIANELFSQIIKEYNDYLKKKM